MPIPLLLAPVLAELAKNGLNILAGAITAKGKEVVEEKLGVNIEDALGSEEGRLKLRQLEIDHEEFLVEATQKKAELEFKSDELEYKNTQGAREMNEHIQESEHASELSKNASYYLDFFIVGSTFLMIGFLFFFKIDPANKEFFYMALGSLLTMCVTVVNFHRGSSSRSASKDEVIKTLSAGQLR